MKAVILAGGLGTRLAEETNERPKPMVEIGGKPIIWHIMKIFSSYGINEFIVCCGYKGYYIKEYFNNFFLRNADVEFDLKSNNTRVTKDNREDWKVTCVDTGEETLTGGRLKRVKEYLDPNETFMFTYGDGLSDVNIDELIKFHRKNEKMATVTAVRPPQRFGVLQISKNNDVSRFAEKPTDDQTWINGGYFVLEPEVIDFIDGDLVSWEKEPVERICSKGELKAFKHTGFWQPMDTLSEKNYLESLYLTNPPWKKW